jgi:hypothetical protein
LTPALQATGLKGIHLHDLRHTGNQFSADAGANIRELMERTGHDSTRAALIYLHGRSERQRAIAARVGKNAKAALGQSTTKRCDPARADLDRVRQSLADGVHAFMRV